MRSPTVFSLRQAMRLAVSRAWRACRQLLSERTICGGRPRRTSVELEQQREERTAALRERTIELATINAKLEREIAEHQQAEEERDQFFTLSIDMLCIAGFDGYFKHLNPAWEQTLGFTTSELLATPFLEFVHPEDTAPTRPAAAQLPTPGGDILSVENRYLCKDGSHQWLAWEVTPRLSQQLRDAVARAIAEHNLGD